MRAIRGIIFNVGERNDLIDAIRRDALDHQYEVEVARTHKCKVLLVDSGLLNWLRVQHIMRTFDKQSNN